MGIEPTPSAWKAEVLPLNYTRDSRSAGKINTRIVGNTFTLRVRTCRKLGRMPVSANDSDVSTWGFHLASPRIAHTAVGKRH